MEKMELQMENVGYEQYAGDILIILNKLGLVVREVDGELAAKLRLKETGGLYVVGTRPGGVAEKGGILWEDVVLEVNDTETDTLHDLARALASHTPGRPVRFLLRRAGILRHLAFRLND